MSKLIIVESPAKAKTIKKYLGKDCEVIASMGHVRDLPANKLNVDIKHQFQPNYEIIKGKEKLVKELQKESKKNDEVFLATDPDREGEAISWHLAYLLGVDEKAKNRVTFNEITKSGVQNGMSDPRSIDLNLVDAQQARRILDRIVGYKLSPFLSQKIRKGMSAGRVQSVAVRIIVDREESIRAFVPEEYWTIDAKLLAPGSKKLLSAAFYGKKDEKIKIPDEKSAQQILSEIENENFKVDTIKKGTKRKRPMAPFITSTLQQEASKRLSFQAKRTMKIAQELYEGVEVKGIGAVGLITYMRTDSLRVSQEALDDLSSYIVENFGKEYMVSKLRYFKSKGNVQDGHEAIRPTMVDLSPDKVKSSLTLEQYKLYKLIWERFVASQMSDCVLNTTSVDIAAGEYIFRASGYTVKFDGFTMLYQEVKDDEEKAKELPKLEVGMILKKKEVIKNQHFTEPPARYTEASLIKALEEEGVGRPSTYASIISTITSREYVVRDGKSLKPTELGEVITSLLKERFPNIVNLKFTAQMESDLDTVEDGKKDWVSVLDDFYQDFNDTLKKAKEDMKGVKIQLEADQTDVVCEKCGRKMVVKVSRYGKFLACPGYPECKNIKKMDALSGEAAPVEDEKTDIDCEKCGKKMVIKHGRYGNFLACSGYPECKNVKSMDDKIGVKCPKCGGNIVKKRSKKGRFFFGCDKYPDCDFVSWDEPTEQKCPKCKKNLFIKRGKTAKLYCLDKDCGYEENLQK